MVRYLTEAKQCYWAENFWIKQLLSMVGKSRFKFHRLIITYKATVQIGTHPFRKDNGLIGLNTDQLMSHAHRMIK